jgi:hypothetical protein
MKRGHHPNSRANLKPLAPGTVLNPSGRPKYKPYADAARKVADLSAAELKRSPKDTAAVAAAKALMRNAISRGRFSEFNSLADRAEGKPLQELGGPDGQPLAFAPPVINITFDADKE